MGTVADFVIKAEPSEQKKVAVAFSTFADDISQQIIQKFATGQPIWANDVVVPDCKEDEVLFRLYALEDIGLVSSQIELKYEGRYERRFYLTDVGKQVLNIK